MAVLLPTSWSMTTSAPDCSSTWLILATRAPAMPLIPRTFQVRTRIDTLGSLRGYRHSFECVHEAAVRACVGENRLRADKCFARRQAEAADEIRGRDGWGSALGPDTVQEHRLVLFAPGRDRI